MADVEVAVLVERVDHLITEVRELTGVMVRQESCRLTHLGADATVRELGRRQDALESTMATLSAADTAGRWGLRSTLLAGLLLIVSGAVGAVISRMLA